jgi:hypothetical protein
LECYAAAGIKGKADWNGADPIREAFAELQKRPTRGQIEQALRAFMPSLYRHLVPFILAYLFSKSAPEKTPEDRILIVKRNGYWTVEVDGKEKAYFTEEDTAKTFMVGWLEQQKGEK